MSSAKKARLAEAFWVGSGQIVSVVGALVLVRALTSQLSPSQYGELALALTMFTLFNQIALGGFSASVARHWVVATDSADVSGYTKHAVLLFGAICGVLMISVLIGMAVLWLTGFDDWIAVVWAAAIFAIISGANASLSAIQNAARQRRIVAIHSALNAWLKILLLLVFFSIWEKSALLAIWSYSLTAALVTLSQIYYYARLLKATPTETKKARASYDRTWFKDIWRYASPFTTWGLFTWAQLTSDRWALNLFATEADVGSFAVLYQIGYTPISLATSFGVALIGPILYQISGDSTDATRNAEVARLTRTLVAVALTATFVATLLSFQFHEPIFRLLAGPEFREHSYLLGFLVLAGGVFAAGQLIALRTMADMTVRQTIPVKIGSAIIGVLLNTGLVYLFGLTGAAIAAVGFSSTYFLWLSYLAHRMEKQYC